jgi:3-hydroxybutyryl-CoA dehydrogenase
MGVADVQTIDRSFRNAVGLWSTLFGPLRWIDLSGGQALYARAMTPVLPTLSNATELPARLKELADADAQGITNGRGFYQYTPEEAAHWQRLFHEHAWLVRELAQKYHPAEGDGGQDR